jgi:carbon-monoxide dehydrogenase large subunit
MIWSSRCARRLGLAVREDAPLLHEEAGTNVLAMREFGRGDVGATMATAPVRVGSRFRFHRKAPIAIENRACLAEYDRGRRSLTFTVSTQIPTAQPGGLKVAPAP